MDYISTPTLTLHIQEWSSLDDGGNIRKVTEHPKSLLHDFYYSHHYFLSSATIPLAPLPINSETSSMNGNRLQPRPHISRQNPNL